VENVLYFGAKSNRRYRRLTKIMRACALRIDLKIAVYVIWAGYMKAVIDSSDIDISIHILNI